MISSSAAQKYTIPKAIQPSHNVILSVAKNLGSILDQPSLKNIEQRCFASLNMTAQFMRTILIASIAILTAGLTVPQGSVASTDRQQNVIHQLRIYEIFDANKKAFHDRFRDHAMRIMAKYDFKIVATWESKKDNRTEFVYLLEWPDKETMTDRWKKFLQDQEWIKIKKETGEINGPLVGEVQDRTLYLTDYSPHQVLAK
jgi:NIPSNAP